MKRINNLFDQICSIDNIRLADENARKGKRNRYGIKKHDRNRELNLLGLQRLLETEQYVTSKYHTFTIYEPKERIIYCLPYFPDRIVHHAIMNILEPIWINIFTKDTYSCIKKRGIHKLLRTLKRDLKDVDGTKYCLKLDIVKFYPSINHDILKEIIRKKLKDPKLLRLLDNIIDSADGVPIGNYLSLFFANLYLAYFDHWVKEVLKIKYYYRYADDIVLLSDNKNTLRDAFFRIKQYLKDNLKLDVKRNYLIFPVDSKGIDFVGYVFYHTHILLRKRLKKRIMRLISKYKDGKISKESFEKSITAYYGWLKYCNSKNLLKKINNLVWKH